MMWDVLKFVAGVLFFESPFILGHVWDYRTIEVVHVVTHVHRQAPVVTPTITKTMTKSYTKSVDVLITVTKTVSVTESVGVLATAITHGSGVGSKASGALAAGAVPSVPATTVVPGSAGGDALASPPLVYDTDRVDMIIGFLDWMFDPVISVFHILASFIILCSGWYLVYHAQAIGRNCLFAITWPVFKVKQCILLGWTALKAPVKFLDLWVTLFAVAVQAYSMYTFNFRLFAITSVLGFTWLFRHRLVKTAGQARDLLKELVTTILKFLDIWVTLFSIAVQAYSVYIFNSRLFAITNVLYWTWYFRRRLLVTTAGQARDLLKELVTMILAPLNPDNPAMQGGLRQNPPPPGPLDNLPPVQTPQSMYGDGTTNDEENFRRWNFR